VHAAGGIVTVRFIAAVWRVDTAGRHRGDGAAKSDVPRDQFVAAS